VSRVKLPPPLPPEAEKWLRTYGAQLRKQLDQPLWREQLEHIRRIEVALAALLKLRATPPPRKRKRKPGGGSKRKLTDKEIAKLQKAYRRELKKDPYVRNQEAAVAYVRALLPKAKRDLSSSTFVRWVLRPVLAQVRGK
jgi:hypothetical protein